MNNLIQTDIKTMNSEELATLLQLRHDNVRQAALNLQSHEIITFTEISVKGNGRPKQVLQFDERNSIIIAAKLNDRLLAAVVDRWKELESAAQTPAVALPDFSNPAAAARAWAEQYEISTAAQEQLQLAAPKVEYHDKVLNSDNGLLTTEIAVEFDMSAIKLNRLLQDLKVQRKVGGRWVLTAAMLGQGLTVEGTFIDDNGKSRHSLKWTESGRKLIHELMEGVV